MNLPPAKPPHTLPSKPSSTSARVARERLALLRLQEPKAVANPPYLPALKRELVSWLARRLELSPDAMQVFVRRVLSAAEPPDQSPDQPPPPVRTHLTLEITAKLPTQRSRRDSPSASSE